MTNQGKELESLVRQIEQLLLPMGFSVTCNSKVYNDEGVQIAEFDVEIRGRLGSTDIAWLIECRDRPGSGPAPGAWIEQLVGRRDRFGFNKVTAVSTTGFAPGAEEYASKAGIELRTVSEVTPEDVAEWLGILQIICRRRVSRLNWVRLGVSPDEAEDRREAVQKILKSSNGNDFFLRSTETGELMSIPTAFQLAVSGQPSLYEDLAPNGPAKVVNIQALYTEDSHFVVDTEFGPAHILEILFSGELSVKLHEAPVESIRDYRRLGDQAYIAQVASFPVEVTGRRFNVELHNVPDSGQTHILLRRAAEKL
ncbi:MAG TPA: restriction endonuclease [Thermoanaerobaculia bacterium]|nr:restriction endonuclease [Thermoanaerobaculia bacterium]